MSQDGRVDGWMGGWMGAWMDGWRLGPGQKQLSFFLISEIAYHPFWHSLPYSAGQPCTVGAGSVEGANPRGWES